jgi:hypothetical protein
MRALKKEEQTKRGCIWCADVERKKTPRKTKHRTLCPHDKCPYTVLDKYDTYEDYMKSKDSKINIGGLFDTDWSAGRVTPCAWEKVPVLRRMGNGPLF